METYKSKNYLLTNAQNWANSILELAGIEPLPAPSEVRAKAWHYLYRAAALAAQGEVSAARSVLGSYAEYINSCAGLADDMRLDSARLLTEQHLYGIDRTQKRILNWMRDEVHTMYDAARDAHAWEYSDRRSARMLKRMLEHAAAAYAEAGDLGAVLDTPSIREAIDDAVNAYAHVSGIIAKIARDNGVDL